MELEIVRDVVIGPYHILGVPHIALSMPTPTGEHYIRKARVDLKLAEIYQHMLKTGVNCVEYTNQFHIK